MTARDELDLTAAAVAGVDSTKPSGSRRRRRWGPLRRPAALLAAVVLAGYVVAAVTGSWLAPQDPSVQSLAARLQPPGSTSEAGYHLLGTDQLGRDMASLVIAGAREALLTAGLAIVLAAVAGVLLGMIAGYVGGRLADALLYLTNTQLAFPHFLLALTVVGILGSSFWLVVVVLALDAWVQFARVIYSETQELRELEFIQAVHVMRGSHARVVLRHILPNVTSSMIVIGTFSFGTAVITISSLSFIGLSPPADFPGWGAELSQGRDYLQSAWWLTVCPGAAIFVLVLAVNVLGETLRDHLSRGAHHQS